jgi:hypothetical protein
MFADESVQAGSYEIVSPILLISLNDQDLYAKVLLNNKLPHDTRRIYLPLVSVGPNKLQEMQCAQDTNQRDPCSLPTRSH